jgi:uncharacterized protein (DUF305 family)
MKINYKYTTIILFVLLVLTLITALVFRDHGDMKKGRYDSEKMHMTKDSHMMREDMSMDHMKMGMDTMMMNMTANMKGKSGKDLEKAFITDMIPHHQGAVDMAKLLLQDKTVRPELVKFANDIITAQEAEIKIMNEWLRND